MTGTWMSGLERPLSLADNHLRDPDFLPSASAGLLHAGAAHSSDAQIHTGQDPDRAAGHLLAAIGLTFKAESAL